MNTIIKVTKKDPAKRIKRVLKDASLLIIGGVGYYFIEVLCRGYSHWSMAVCGGVCLWAIFHVNRRLRRYCLALRAAVGAGIITTVEFVCGCIVNLILGWSVWDYSHLPLNLMGQICLPFTLLWFGLCLPICALLGKVRSAQNSR